jgi:hypothetical protein
MENFAARSNAGLMQKFRPEDAGEGSVRARFCNAHSSKIQGSCTSTAICTVFGAPQFLEPSRHVNRCVSLLPEAESGRHEHCLSHRSSPMPCSYCVMLYCYTHL